MRGEPGFFDVDDRLRRLSDLGDQLEAFRSAVDFEIFRADLYPSAQDRSELWSREATWALHFCGFTGVPVNLVPDDAGGDVVQVVAEGLVEFLEFRP